MDKGWISLPRLHPEYIQGVKDFVKYACGINPNSNEIMCPCKKCRNVKLDEAAQQTRMEHLESQLLIRGGPAPREAAWSHHPMSRPQQNSHEFTSSSSHQKVA